MRNVKERVGKYERRNDRTVVRMNNNRMKIESIKGETSSYHNYAREPIIIPLCSKQISFFLSDGWLAG